MNEQLESVPGDGVDGARGEAAVAEMRLLKNVVAEIRTTIADDISARRATAHDTLFCRWEGQNDEGRKNAEDLGEDAEPFEGASDNRVRLCEKLAKEHQRQMVAAALRASPRAVGTESGDAAGASRIETLLRWLKQNQWGSDYRRQLELLAWWQEIDTPAGAVAMVDWETESAIRMREVTADEVAMLAVARVQNPTPEDTENLANMVYNAARAAELADLLPTLFPGLRPARAGKIALALYDDGKAEIPEKYDRISMPVIAAKRLYQDIFFPANTTDIQRAPVAIVRDWLCHAEVLERQATNGWTDKFVEELLKHEGESAFDVNETGEKASDTTSETDIHAGKFEVLRAFRRVANEDGAICIHLTTFSGSVDVAAKPTELFKRKHGKYPFIPFMREYLTDRLIDSRGVPETLATDQAGVKLLKDSFEDHVQVNMWPPLMGPAGVKFKLQFGPKSYIPIGMREKIERLQAPTYPQAADRYWTEMRREINEFDGRPGPEIDPMLVQLAQQDRVDRFLSSQADMLGMVVQLCQEFMTDEQVQRVVGGGGMAIARSVEEIQGKYDIQLSFDVRDLDLDGVMKKADVILKNLKPLDVRAILPYEQIVSRMLALIDPNLADMVASVESADAREIAEERSAFVSMLNGVEPEMPDGGINAALRMQTLQQLIGERNSNPGAYPPVSPISQAMVENRLKYLEFQQQQMANADIGRTGAEPVDPRRIGTTNNQQPTANSQSRTANRQQPTASGGPEGVA